MSTHTPGPWRLHTPANKGWQNKYQIERSDGACLFSFGDSPFHSDAAADARLIAAAPELLDSCKSLVRMYDEGASLVGLVSQVLAEARAAIAKATGEQP